MLFAYGKKAIVGKTMTMKWKIINSLLIRFGAIHMGHIELSELG